MNPEWKVRWLAALESDRYQQTREVLRRTEDSLGYPAGFCCLGVLADIQGLFEADIDPRRGGDELLAVKYACGLTETEQQTLASMNDGKRLPFQQIALYVRQNIDDLDHTED